MANTPSADTTTTAGSGMRILNNAIAFILSRAQFTIGMVIMLIVLIAAFLAPILRPGSPLDMVAMPLLGMGEDLHYPLGTDSIGRDVLAQLLHGARISLMVGGLAAAIGTCIGVVIGSFAGYLGGGIDAILVRITEIFQTTPTFLLTLAIVAVSGASIATIVFAIGISSWPQVARLARAEFRSAKQDEYVQAAVSLGYGMWRIMFTEILPNVLPSIVVIASVMMANAMLTEAGLSFLGLSDPNAVSWGSMIGSGRDLLRTNPMLVLVPGLAITFTVMALNLIGDGLNEWLNPRTGVR